MAYTQDEKVSGLDTKTTPVAADFVPIGDTSDSGRAKKTPFSDFVSAVATYITTVVGGFVNSVTGLNTDNTDPQNPIVKISVDGVTITGDGTPGSPLSALGSGGGGGGGGGTKIAIDTTEVTVSGGATASVFTIPIPARILGTNNGIKWRLEGGLFDAANPDPFTVNMKYGGSTIASVTFQSPSSAGTENGWVLDGFIVADGATNVQKGQITGYSKNSTAPSFPYIETNNGTGAVDSTIVQNLVIEIDNSANASPVSVESIIVEEISGKGIKVISINIPSADVLQLNSTPVELIPAPAAGRVLDIISAVGRITYNSVTYTTNLNLQITVGGTPIFSNANLLGDTSTTIRKFVNTAATLLSATAAEITVQTGNPAAGDSDIDIYLVYQEIEL